MSSCSGAVFPYAQASVLAVSARRHAGPHIKLRQLCLQKRGSSLHTTVRHADIFSTVPLPRITTSLDHSHISQRVSASSAIDTNEAVHGGDKDTITTDNVQEVVAAVFGAALRRFQRVLSSICTSLLGPVSSSVTILPVGFSGGRLLMSAVPLFFAATSQSTTVNTPLTVIASAMSKWLELYGGLLFIRVLLSWFPNIDWERQPMMAIRDMCDPYLNLYRNILPPLMGILDLSPMLAFLVLGILSNILNTSIA